MCIGVGQGIALLAERLNLLSFASKQVAADGDRYHHPGDP
jgi:hypothetical protein